MEVTPNGASGKPDERDEDDRQLYFCRQCPARFLFSRELAIHRRFHRVKLQFHCGHCNYTARQPQHLAAHNKVHCSEYQDRTALLLMSHLESQEHPKPALVVRDDAWVVLDPDDNSMPVLKQQAAPSGGGSVASNSSGTAIKQHCCHLCPARFFKAVALQYHITLHGGSGPYKCSKCDYVVKMYGNLVRHEVVHDETENELVTDDDPPMPPVPVVQMNSPPPQPQPMMRQMPQLQVQQHPALATPPIALPSDPVFGTLMHGSPDFIYPTYWKNGKLKEKRYKCHKCPSAFEKREQYKVHLGLHGSKQKYNCERCDYSVKYYANFIQHSKKHDNNDRARQEQQQQLMDEEDRMQMEHQMGVGRPPSMADDEYDDEDAVMTVLAEPEVVLLTKPAPIKMLPGHTSVQRQQQMMVMERRKLQEEPKVEQQITTPTFWCSSCPYNNQRRELVEAHLKRHQRHAHPDTKSVHACCYCDYVVPQRQQLQEHMLLHFRIKPLPNSRRAVTFTKYDQVEIWSTNLDQDEETESRLIITGKPPQDTLVKVQSDEEEEEDDDDVQFIDLRTGETVVDEHEKLQLRDQALVAAN